MAMLLKVVLSEGNRADGVIAFCLYLINLSIAVPDGPGRRRKSSLEYYWFDRFLLF